MFKQRYHFSPFGEKERLWWKSSYRLRVNFKWFAVPCSSHQNGCSFPKQLLGLFFISSEARQEPAGPGSRKTKRKVRAAAWELLELQVPSQQKLPTSQMEKTPSAASPPGVAELGAPARCVHGKTGRLGPRKQIKSLPSPKIHIQLKDDLSALGKVSGVRELTSGQK